MRVLLIDPWGTNNTAEYLNGLIYGLSDNVELTVITNEYFELQGNPNVNLKRFFFKKTEKMELGFKRKLLRGFEYILAYRRIFRFLKNNPPFDVIHINWLLFYQIDSIILPKLKKYCRSLVYTAHNAVPHVNDGKCFKQLAEIYQVVDKIIVHGDAIKNELCNTFKISPNKLYVQKHGCVLKNAEVVDCSILPGNVFEKIESYSKVYLFLGAIFPNKGVDRLMRSWIEYFSEADALMIIAGRQNAPYPEYEELKSKFSSLPNTLLLDRFVDDPTLNALIYKADVIVLPYVHASMSGVVFTAAQFSKPVLCTDVGALPEYLEDGVDSFVCVNNDVSLILAMQKVQETNRDDLIKMGRMLNSNINRTCEWKSICKGLVQNGYSY